MSETQVTGTGTSMYSSGNPDRPYDEIDLSSREFWATTTDEREKTFAVLRGRPSITWHRPFDEQIIEDPEDYGFWAITTYDDLVEVTKHHEDFLSSPGILMENLPAEFIESAQSIIGMDPPRHTKLRRLVASAFTRKQMRKIDDLIAANAEAAVENLITKAEANGGQADFVEECAGLMPTDTRSPAMRSSHWRRSGSRWCRNEPSGPAERLGVLGRYTSSMASP